MTVATLYTNPTDPVLPYRHRYQILGADGWVDTDLPWYWKDCRTTGTVITEISYRYYGVRNGGQVVPEYSDPIIVLKQKEN